MPLEIRTPFSRDAARRTGDTWRKRVLPVGEIEYQGRLLKFDKSYLEGLAQAFNARAYDQVPFQLADAKNQHTNDPERFRGEVQKMDVGSDGLYVTVKTTEAGNAVLSANPKLGISARIVEDYARSDGQYYPVAIQHVLGTLDPRVNSLGPWERVELSNGVTPDMLIDLSAATFAGETQEGGLITMPDLDADQSARLGRLLEIDPDKLNQVLDTLGTGSEGTSDLSEEDLADVIAAMPDDEFALLQAEFDIEPEPALAGAGLSNDGYGLNPIDLTNYELAETQRQLSVLQGEHDKSSYEAEKQQLTRQHNVPPFITELARPLLEGTGHTVELSSGGAVDAGLVMRRVLQAFGQVTRDLGLDSPVELGTAMDEPDTTQHAAKNRADFVADFRSYVGI
jgi:hypothetical protein